MIFRFSHRFRREILVKFSVAHPNPGKRSTENFTKISSQISQHLWQRKTENNFTSALLQGSCSDNSESCDSMFSVLLSAKPKRGLTKGGWVRIPSSTRGGKRRVLGECRLPRRNTPLDRVFASQEKHCQKPVSAKSRQIPSNPAMFRQIPSSESPTESPRDYSFARGAYRQIPSSAPPLWKGL